jgi:hypothetical protein
MMAMFGWIDPKLPAHYIAKANRKRLGMSGMHKVCGVRSEAVARRLPRDVRLEQKRNVDRGQRSNFP